RTISVELGRDSYDVVVGEGALDELGPRVATMGAKRVAIITDSHVSDIAKTKVEPLLAEHLPTHRIELPAGENSKSLASASEIYERLLDLEMRRDDLVVTIGGGMIGDLGGFVASTFQRGVQLVHVPTTLLAQVDAAIGGKTAVNLARGKNLVGTFYQPALVVCDTSLLVTLPDRQFRSGAAEVVKYALTFGGGLLDRLRSDPWPPSGLELDETVALCVDAKARVVSGDRADRGERLFLNYGHTLGHAIEAAGGYERWTHGEAIALGMVFASGVSHAMGLVGEDVVQLHRHLLEKVGLPVRDEIPRLQTESAMTLDKKHAQRQRWVLLGGVGRPVIRDDVPDPAIEAGFEAIS
ncbi:MAG TPA: 3-dehydroquinate synthase, partial [Actinomycetota bacterium]|nr:3-dehydroquinate synthase [Actinomycetota bacterium]